MHGNAALLHSIGSHPQRVNSPIARNAIGLQTLKSTRKNKLPRIDVRLARLLKLNGERYGAGQALLVPKKAVVKGRENKVLGRGSCFEGAFDSKAYTR